METSPIPGYHHPMPRTAYLAHRTAFSLIELLVVITIISALAAMLMPTIKMVRESALRAACMSNQRSLAMATLAYGNDWDGFMPSGGQFNSAQNGDWLSSPGLVLVVDYMGVTANNNTVISRAVRCPANRTGSIYAMWGTGPVDVPVNITKMLNLVKRYPVPGDLPALWSDLCFNQTLGQRDFNNSCGHKGARLGPTSGTPAGGNVARVDGSVVWAPLGGVGAAYDDKRPNFVYYGGTIGGYYAIPNCAIWWRTFSNGTLDDTAGRFNLVIGKNSVIRYDPATMP